MSARDFEQWTHAEVAEWPGARVRFEARAKHNSAIICFGGKERFVTYPTTPSDNGRALYNHISDVRHALTQLGAKRQERAKSSRPPSKPNVGAKLRQTPGGEPAPVMCDPWEALKAMANSPLITEAGAYQHIAAEDYHRNANLLPGPSLSSSGAKKLLAQSPYHYWFDSPLNPDRPPEPDKPHFNVGKAAHDFVLLSERWPDHYHVLPEGFSRAATKKFAAEIEEADEAAEAGLTILKHDEAETVKAVAAALQRNSLAVATLTNGVTEETLCWQDPRTGVWLRARPDFRPNSILEKRDVMVVSDLKFVAPSNASPEGFAKAIHNFGYHQSAAFYSDGIKAVYGHYPTHWVHVVVEKPEAGTNARHAPLTVSLYELPAEDIERGRYLNRRAIDLFARCLERGEWPGYADDPKPVGLPIWSRMRIDDFNPDELAFADAA
jgi:hypothetical protein